ncbi:MAG: hypothetical protein HOW97_05075 [Catenulispora sp.]|nr:hypothetical protein [Catenulispora sp.]
MKFATGPFVVGEFTAIPHAEVVPPHPTCSEKGMLSGSVYQYDDVDPFPMPCHGAYPEPCEACTQTPSTECPETHDTVPLIFFGVAELAGGGGGAVVAGGLLVEAAGGGACVETGALTCEAGGALTVLLGALTDGAA